MLLYPPIIAIKRLNALSESWHEHDPVILNKMLDEINFKLETTPDDLELLMEKASILRHLNKLDEAMNIHQLLITREPKNLDFIFMMGLMCIESERYEEAIKNFKDLLKKNPKHRDAHFNIGLAYKKLGKKKLADKHLKKALSF